MALILNIDTATEYAGICLSDNGNYIGKEEHLNQKNHASFLQPAIRQILEKTGKKLNELDAVAVTGGPGSYTGIRVGMSSAKGLCFALNKPLIVINTLLVIAQAALEEQHVLGNRVDANTIFCPMIDARRMEVFASVYDWNLLEIKKSGAFTLEDDFFNNFLKNQKVVFCGTGAKKIVDNQLKLNMFISESQHSVNQMIKHSEAAYFAKEFANLATVEPLYVKEFFNPKSS
jgi:tRNA threonylcarbamoyladenosine biosynthesis protein TsaB